MENGNMVVEPKKKGNGLTVALLTIVIILLVGIVALLVFKPDYFKLSDDDSTTNSGTTVTTDNGNTTDSGSTTSDNTSTSTDEIKEIDLSKSLNTTDYIYSGLSEKDEGGKYFTLKANDDKKSATITITAEGGKVICEAIKSSCGDQGYDIAVGDFDKKIKSTYIGGLGQSVEGTVFYFLMEDGTVEYVKLLNRKMDSNEIVYYVDATREKPQVVSGVSDIVKLYGANASAPQSAGYYTTLAAKKNGSFYDLSKIIK